MVAAARPAVDRAEVEARTGHKEGGAVRKDSETLADGVRFVLSDDSGTMRFERFDILNAPECSAFVTEAQAYLSGRALAEIDMDHVRQLCRGDCPECIAAVEGVLLQYRDLFGGSGSQHA